MFLIAGVSPKTKVIDNTPRRCPVCGLVRAHYQRVDHYFNLFFIPILRVKKGAPFLMCNRCSRPVGEFKEGYDSTWPDTQKTRCNHCGKTLEKAFGYCPYCGKPVARE